MTKCKHDDGDCYCDQYNAEMTMSDSLQKVIDDCKEAREAVAPSGNGYWENKRQLQAFADTIRQDQIENNEKEFIHLIDAMIESTIKYYSDSSLAVQQLNTLKSQVEAQASYRKYFEALQKNPVAWMTHHDEPMLFLTEQEAASYCEDDEKPIPLIRGD